MCLLPLPISAPAVVAQPGQRDADLLSNAGHHRHPYITVATCLRSLSVAQVRLGFRPCAMTAVHTSPPLLWLPAPAAVAVTCSCPLSRSTGLVGFWVAVWGTGEGGAQRRERRRVATAMGDDEGRRLTADRHPVGPTGQQQQVQKRVVAVSTRNPNPSPDPTR